MSTTTAWDLLERADRCIRELRDCDVPTTSERWDSFDDTVYRLLVELVGLDAQHVRTADPSHRALAAAIRTYPAPLRPPVDTWLRPTQVARYEDRSPGTVRRVHRSALHVVKDADAELIHSRHVQAQSRARPADPTDRHPLGRAATALGVMADLLHEARTRQIVVLASDGEVAGTVQHVLSLAAVAARHTISIGDLDDAVRPLRVGRYAERVVDGLRDNSAEPTSLDRLRSTANSPGAQTTPDMLANALQAWTTATRLELRRAVPSVDVLTQMANQGAHLCRVRLDLAPPDDPAKARLQRTESQLAEGAQAWARLTTLTRPSHEFVRASRDLYEALRQTHDVAPRPEHCADSQPPAEVLERGLDELGYLLRSTRSLPWRLLEAGALRGPARQLPATDERLQARVVGRYVTVRRSDVPHLPDHWEAAAASIQAVRLDGNPLGFIRDV